ncbi:MAG: hypothetical protein K2W89_15675, partial [Sphingomonas ginsenosidimutans]|nr:hypothetical protein [Sphingomonas ginsenosidimutans]
AASWTAPAARSDPRRWRGGWRRRARLADVGRLVDSLNPDRILERGYARVEGQDGATLTTAVAARAAGAIRLRFRDGAVAARVTEGDAPPPPPAKVERKPARAYPDSGTAQPRLL